MRTRALAAVAVLAVACSPLPNGSTGVFLTGMRSGGLYNLISDGDGGLVHVLVLKPQGSQAGSKGGGFQLNWTSAIDRTIWMENGTEHSLTLAYRLFPRRFEIDGQSWSLETGNVFVVRLDQEWHPSVEPLSVQTQSTSSLEVLKQVQGALPRDREIASLRVDE